MTDEEARGLPQGPSMTDDELAKLESWALRVPYSARPSDLAPLFAEVRRLRAPRYLAARLRHQREQASRFDGPDDACACSDCVLVRGGQ